MGRPKWGVRVTYGGCEDIRTPSSDLDRCGTGKAVHRQDGTVTDEDPDGARKRWLDAESSLERRPTPAAKRRQWRSLTARVALIVCLLVVAVGIGAIWDIHGSWTPTTGQSVHGPAGQTVGLALVVAGILIAIVGLIWMIRSGQFKPAWKSPLLNLSWRERRQLTSLIRRGDPAPAGGENLARYLADRMSHQYAYLLFIRPRGQPAMPGEWHHQARCANHLLAKPSGRRELTH